MSAIIDIDKMVADIGDGCSFSMDRTTVRSRARKHLEKLVAELSGQASKEASSNRVGPSNGSLASSLAAADNYPRSGTQRARVLAAIIESGHNGLTRDEISELLDMPENSIRPRVLELLDGGFVQEVPHIMRETRNGSLAVTLISTPRGESVR